MVLRLVIAKTQKILIKTNKKHTTFESKSPLRSIEANNLNEDLESQGPFKSDLELCIYLVEHPNLINLTLNMMKANGQEPATIQGKVVDRFSSLPEKVGFNYNLKVLVLAEPDL
ncbi:hypothetical protein C2G38_2150566 [Gigaspora rosea]|uniref:Uncharacterized protein n=1 Tax=Gigaspora rosea TaxID=44941 RepID=A0A397TTQ2_9GLOM|nr:hypothetical protein C2G38_2150566 [Gigaspora rosea]